MATVWLDRPEARNAMGLDLWRDLPRAMAAVGADPEVRAVVIAATGPISPSGSTSRRWASLLAVAGTASGHGDVGRRPSAAVRAAAARTEVLRLQDAITAVAECPKPVIAAVHGYCIGGGVDLVAACDIRLASADAVFSVRETKMAIVADLGSLQRLPSIIGAGPRGRARLHGQGHQRRARQGDRPRQRGAPPTPRRARRPRVRSQRRSPRTPRSRSRARRPCWRPTKGRTGRGRARLRRDVERRELASDDLDRGGRRLHGEASPDLHRALRRPVGPGPDRRSAPPAPPTATHPPGGRPRRAASSSTRGRPR